MVPPFWKRRGKQKKKGGDLVLDEADDGDGVGRQLFVERRRRRRRGGVGRRRRQRLVLFDEGRETLLHLLRRLQRFIHFISFNHSLHFIRSSS